jgi:hypothetical protein
MTEITFEWEDGETVLSPTWESIEEALPMITPRGPGFFILSRPDGSYVQTAGARLRLIVEYRKILGSGQFAHYVLGKHIEAAPKQTQINASIGVLNLMNNEILTVKDAIAIFREFYLEGTVPGTYILHDVTADFPD